MYVFVCFCTVSVAIWEILSDCQRPFGSDSNTQVIINVSMGGTLECSDSWNSQLCGMLYDCWSSKPEERPTAEALGHLASELFAQADARESLIAIGGGALIQV